jgi:hypothetical protein
MTPTQISFRKNLHLHITHDTEIDKWIAQRHYLHSVPAGAILRMCFLDDHQNIIGGMMWGRPTARALDQKNLLELTRMCFLDNTEPFIESRALAMARKHIRKHCPTVKGLISYSSTGQGHEGTIYKADNWFVLGITKSGSWQSRPNRVDRDLSPKMRWTRSP